MTNKKIYVAVCGVFANELNKLAQAPGLEGVVPVSARADAATHAISWDEIKRHLPERGPADIHIYGCTCLANLPPSPDSTYTVSTFKMDHCAEFIAGRDMVKRCLDMKRYPLAPGQLADWIGNMQRDGMNAADTKNHYRDNYKGFVLFDTGVIDGIAEKLKEFTDFTGMPAETVYVGLDYFRTTLTANIKEAEIRAEMGRLHEELLDRRKLATNYAFALEFISGMAAPRTARRAFRILN